MSTAEADTGTLAGPVPSWQGALTGAVQTLRALFEEVLLGGAERARRDTVLATVLFTDIVGSTTRVANLGDRRWRRLLEAHDLSVRRRAAAHGGKILRRLGDGYMVTFDRPARAIRFAHAMGQDARALGIEVKSGIHAGECEQMQDDVTGIAVHIGARVMSLACPGEILATNVVRDLVVGSGIKFADRGVHELKGVPGQWTLHAVAL